MFGGEHAKKPAPVGVNLSRSAKRLHGTGDGHQSRQIELGMYQLRRALSIFFVDNDRDFDLGGRDQLNVDSVPTQAFEHSRGHAGM